MSEKPELKPCPFCGGEAHIEHGLVTWAVVCPCGSHVFYGCEKDKKKTAEAWNARAVKTCYLFERASFGIINGITLGLYECSECGYGINPKEEFNYCPNCGAKVVQDA